LAQVLVGQLAWLSGPQGTPFLCCDGQEGEGGGRSR